MGDRGTEERYIRKIVKAEEIWCQGYSEPNSGSDLASVQTRAIEDGDDFRVNGSENLDLSGAIRRLDIRALPHRSPKRPSIAASATCWWI